MNHLTARVRHIPMGTPTGPEIAAALVRRAGNDPTALQLGQVFANAWRDIDAALSPIIGQRGVAALYQRSLHLNRVGHASGAAAGNSLGAALDIATLDIAVLRAALAHRTPDEAAAVGGAILQTLHELLTDLIGASLTERLLRSVWANFLSGESPQDSLP